MVVLNIDHSRRGMCIVTWQAAQQDLYLVGISRFWSARVALGKGSAAGVVRKLQRKQRMLSSEQRFRLVSDESIVAQAEEISHSPNRRVCA